jgi:hypothetical protein
MNDVDPSNPYGYDPTSQYGVPGTGGQPPSGPEPMPVGAPLDPSGPQGPAAPQGPSGKRRFFSRRRNLVATVAIAVVAVAGITVGFVATSGSSSSTTTANTTSAGVPFAGASGGQGSNARSTNEPGGSAGTVSTVSSTGFTLTTTIGETITVNESSSTTYQNATSGTATSSTASAVATGDGILVLGTVNGTTIAATQVTIEPAGSPYTTASSDVTALQQGQQNTSQSYGTIPSDYTEGEGTIVDATTSDQAVTAALAEYPGGIVDRVVQLADGDYEVHDIGTNMHHIFENSSFQVIGAN